MRVSNQLDSINEIFDEIRIGHDKELMKSYNPIEKHFDVVDSSNEGYQDYTSLSGITDVPALGAGPVTETNMYQLYDTRIDYKEYAVSVPIEHALIRFAKYDAVKNIINELTYAAYKRKVTQAENIFINGHSATKTSTTGGGTGDGVALFSASHPSTVPSIAVRSNTGTSSLDATAVAATRLLGYKTKDANGQFMGNHYDTLVVGVNKADDAYTIANTPKQTGGGNNDLSANYGLNVEVLRYGNPGNKWYMYNSQTVKKDLKYVMFEQPRILKDMKIDLMLFYTTLYMNINPSWIGFESIYGHNV